MSFKIKIRCIVSDDIFSINPIRNKITTTFLVLTDQMENRHEEIRSFLLEHGLKDAGCLNYDNVISAFKVYVYKALLNEAVEKTLDIENNEFNIIETLSGIITERRVTELIFGEPMVRAFSYVIRNMPEEDYMESLSKASIILLMEKRYLNDHQI